MWRLGGRHSSFKMGAGTGFAWQHDARWQPDDTLTIFDDGATRRSTPVTRDPRAHQLVAPHVELVGRYVRTPPLITGSQGNDQVLADGNSLVGWGEEPYITEFNPAGQILFEAHIPPPGSPIAPTASRGRAPAGPTGSRSQSGHRRSGDRVCELERRDGRQRMAGAGRCQRDESLARERPCHEALRQRSR